MNEIMELGTMLELVEGEDFEAKLAGGREGRGKVPDSFFETYSAFANNNGGIVMLGLRERRSLGGFEVVGIADIDGTIKELWDRLNNTQCVNENLLGRQHV